MGVVSAERAVGTILANLALNAGELAKANQRRDELLAERLGLIHEAQAAGLTLMSVADVAGVTHQAICNVLRREKARAS